MWLAQQFMIRIPIVIWGTSGHSLVVSNIVRLRGQYEIAGYLDDVHSSRKGTILADKPILGGYDALPVLKKNGIQHVALAFGHCSARVRVAAFLKKNDFEIVTLIHPDAVIAESATVGEGTVISAGVIIDPGCKVGKYTIVNNAAVICHGSTIGNGVHICPSVSIGGDVFINSGCWVGIGSCIVQRIHVGERSYIGAGSVVTKDLPEGILAYGNPARIIRSIKIDF
jgi:acetyltransferase EpsM